MPQGAAQMLFSNHRKDTVRSGIYKYTQNSCEVSLACPFFSNEEVITEITRNKCRVRLVVRLCSTTTPQALAHALTLGAQVRFFTSPLFHSKLYIFGEQIALVGSANLTGSGVQSNQEIMVGVLPDDERFESLVRIFQRYWNAAEPFDERKLQEYSKFFRAKQRPRDPFDDDLKTEFGNVAPEGIQVGLPKPSKEKAFLGNYRRTYQEFLNAFRLVQSIYVSEGVRKQPKVPLRIEIDSFFSYVRETFTTGESYKAAPILVGNVLEDHVRARIKTWADQPWPYLESVMPVSYSMLTKTFADNASLDAAPYSDITTALSACHAFREQLRFFKGGLQTVIAAFSDENAVSDVKRVLDYLLFGEVDFIERMGVCIFDPRYELHHFGRACVQELFGWVNKDDAPICNGRTVKSLRYLGFNILVF